MDRVYSYEEAAATLGLTLGQLLTAIDERQITAYQLNGNWTIEQAQIDRYRREQRRDASGRRTIMEG